MSLNKHFFPFLPFQEIKRISDKINILTCSRGHTFGHGKVVPTYKAGNNFLGRSIYLPVEGATHLDMEELFRHTKQEITFYREAINLPSLVHPPISTSLSSANYSYSLLRFWWVIDNELNDSLGKNEECSVVILLIIGECVLLMCHWNMLLEHVQVTLSAFLT